ncbi:MAG: C40 family peptidase [Bacteroidales bacterium]|nr:C40 family peptidase [Bacteroidales bacterium]MBO5848437.1 C40 family peptidase [Bacteroidales bacterium]MBO5854468.1 C40 family peptidase [Bacteroidales bacterium]
MRRGICKLSVVPMRKEASHESELVSELLFNDIYEITEENEEWLKIRCLYDLYEGWIRKLQHCEIDENEFNGYLNKEKFIINSPVALYNNKTLSFGSKIFEKTESSILLRKNFDSRIMVESAIKLLDTPYRWGGKSVMGIDCSAFVQLCAKVAGFKLPRDASQQVNHGMTINFISEIQAGDIAFFENENRRITHVGILLSNDKIIHASGKVRIDTFDQTGIFNKENKRHTHILSTIKRLK